MRLRSFLAAATLLAAGAGPAAAAVAPATAGEALPAHALTAVGSYAADSAYPPKCGVCHQNYPYANWALIDGYDLAATASGALEVSRLRPNSGVLVVETVDPATYRVTSQKTIRLSGGWKVVDDYLASDGSLYVLTTHANNDDSDARDVVAVRKYDASLDQVGIAKLTSGAISGGVNFAPATGAPSMAMLGTHLLVNMSRLVYATAGPGEHHEASMAFVVDTATMTAAATASTYVSHSFNQFVTTDGTLAYFLDHGDAYPRALTLDVIKGYDTGLPGVCSDCIVKRLEILKFPGSVGDNFTGATANGLAVGPSGVLTTGVSDPQDHPLHGVRGNKPSYLPNVYLLSTDVTAGTTKFEWLTRNPPRTKTDIVGQPRMTQVGADAFAIVFDEELGKRRSLQYRLVNSAGAVLASRSWPGLHFGAISQPALVAGRLLWVAPRTGATSGADYLYGLDVANPTKPTLLAR